MEAEAAWAEDRGFETRLYSASLISIAEYAELPAAVCIFQIWDFNFVRKIFYS